MLTEPEQKDVEATLAQAAVEVLSNAMGVKAQQVRPQRIQPLALVLSKNDDGFDTVSVVAILDPAQRVGTLRAALEQCHGFAFIFLYDGFINTNGTKTDALLMVSGTAWGTWHASASPYKHGGVGATFQPTLQVPEAATAYHEVFSDNPYKLPAASDC